ncbi:MAG: hypothetical protein J3K34DRAFT_382253 [Monoraphidium minutum]|nr:MAG: hypothetical protein J3K34DRAFT_382253 [Monoraphidium minutum]
MARAEELAGAEGADWWSAEVVLPEELFQFDFVVVDSVTGAVDNNKAKDYALSLVGGPTEQDVVERRAAAYAEAERQRHAVLQAEEDRQWALVEALAAEAADKARVEFRERRARELLAAATEAVTRRRSPALAALPAAAAVPNKYAWTGGGGVVRAGERLMLAYNCGGGPLAYTNSAKLHLGVDGWKDKKSTVYELAPLKASEMAELGLPAGGGSWCGAWVDVPSGVEVLNFVFSDKDQRAWDNNGSKDYHTLVEGPPESENMLEAVLDAMTRESEATDAAGEERAALRAAHHIQSRARVARKRREAQQEVLYTVPLVPRAGETCELHYNPTVTPLRGRPDVYVSGGFNRWRHPARHGPALMQPTATGGLGFLKAVVDVPEDAATLDLVFQDAPGAHGFTDDNGGLDYHIPVQAAAGVAQGLKVVHIAVEMAPIAKVGGMGDVVTALGRAVQDEGHDVEVVVPKYDVINYNNVEELVQEGSFFFENSQVKVWKGKVEGLPTTFLEPENGHFWRGCIYGRNDDHVRFGYFCGAAMEYIKVRNVRADVIHAHDWPSAPACWGPRGNAGCVFTIHNLNYGADLIGRAMQACDVATTVSPTYAREISGAPPIAPHLSKMYGIRNGIDQDIWDPSADEFLPMPYGPDTHREGKAAARAELRRRMGLADVDVPIVAVVTRLVHQKGIHLIKHAAWRTLERGGQFVLLGSAPDGKVQAEFNALRDQLVRQYPERAGLWFAYDEPLSHLIYAASDMFLVPSMFEPCGLTQMVAMRYGTVPVVRKTGGLNDTVFDIDHDEERAAAAGLAPNGFSFESTDTAGLDYALNRALSVWYSDRSFWDDLVGRIMMQDWSWDDPAYGYISLYYKALKR